MTDRAALELDPEALVSHWRRPGGLRALGERVAPIGGPGVLSLALEEQLPLRDDEAARLAADLRTLPAVLVGVHAHGEDAAHALAAACDAVVSREAAPPLLAAIARRPLASVAFAQLLRMNEGRSVHDGLWTESLVYSMLQAGSEFSAWRAARRDGPLTPDRETPVRVTRCDDALEIVLNRPARHNAFSRDLRDALVEALDLAVADDGVRALRLSGAGPSFCSGGELAEFGSSPDPASAHAVRCTRSPAALFAVLAARIHVTVHGACLGAGVELPSFAARVVARPDAFFGLPELDLGLVPGAGGSVSLPPRIGRQRTAWLGLSGERIDAETARRWGLVDAVEPAAETP